MCIRDSNDVLEKKVSRVVYTRMTAVLMIDTKAHNKLEECNNVSFARARMYVLRIASGHAKRETSVRCECWLRDNSCVQKNILWLG